MNRRDFLGSVAATAAVGQIVKMPLPSSLSLKWAERVPHLWLGTPRVQSKAWLTLSPLEGEGGRQRHVHNLPHCRGRGHATQKASSIHFVVLGTLMGYFP